MKISKRLEVKPGCVRSVQINPNTGRGVWNCKGKAITGEAFEDQFLVDVKFRNFLKDYNPQRISTKANNSVIKQSKLPTETIEIAGEIRVIRYTNLAKTRGIVNLFGKKYVLVKEENDEWKTTEIGKTFFVKDMTPNTAYSRSYYYGKKYNKKFSVRKSIGGVFVTVVA